MSPRRASGPLAFALLVAATLALPAAVAAQSACAADACAHPATRDAGVTVVYLVRHAEKVSDGSDDPPLSDAGRRRAETLARMFADAGIDAVYTTPYERTRATAATIAAALGLEVREYDASAPEALVRSLAGAGGRHLVVGHSNTIPDLVRLFGGVAEPMPETDYGRFYEVVIGPDAVHTVVLGYTP